MTEEWRPVGGWPYEVSSLGRVRRTCDGVNTKAGRVLTTNPSRISGYVHGCLIDGPRRRPFKAHALVMEAFVGPRPRGLAINHIDGDKTNNRPENLEYCTWGENARHAVTHQLFAVGERIGQAKLVPVDVYEIRALWRSGIPTSTLGKLYGISGAQAWKVASGQQWKHIA